MSWRCEVESCLTEIPETRERCRFHSRSPFGRVSPVVAIPEPEPVDDGLLKRSRYHDRPQCPAFLTYTGERCGRREGHRDSHRSEYVMRTDREARRRTPWRAA